MEYWETNARHWIDARQIPCTDITEKDSSLSMPSMDFDLNKYHILSATTSGTTSKPKKILHNYQYFINIAKRNCQVLNLSGKAAHVRNLHHGSSLPVYFLPSVMSCDLHLCLTWIEPNSITDEYLYEIMSWTEYLDINHIFFPYSSMLVQFLQMISQRNMQFTNLRLYTLYYIDPDLKKYIKDRNIEIVSIFGCTETSGPILINRLNNQNSHTFDPTIFYAPDDFFTIEPSESTTRIRSRCGTIDHVMHDRFVKLEDNHFKHIGRSDFYRINDIEINLIQMQQLKDRLHINGEIVVDLLKQTLYLAMWDNSNCASTQELLNDELKNLFDSDLIYISKSANLNKFDFMSGIKPNQELLRNYFRLMEKF
jgi:acyl-CoA synthetase (AMP-forming)/AMP-acid ligase II